MKHRQTLSSRVTDALYVTTKLIYFYGTEQVLSIRRINQFVLIIVIIVGKRERHAYFAQTPIE